jgi:hypothetical protein
MAPLEHLKQIAPGVLIGVSRGSETPAKVLGRAARAAVRARAGHKPPNVAGTLPACPVDPTAVANTNAAAILSRLLNDPDEGLIEEWATLARKRSLRVPDPMVTDLIDWWARQPRRSEAVFGVMGERGKWLAPLNPDWRKPVALSEVPANAESLWHTGSGAERSALLTTIRRVDPARALTLVQSTWSSDGADERRRFIEALGDGATMADEPFLESALDDRAKSVRRSAADVLRTITGSRLRQRLTLVARDIIKVEKKKGLLKRGVKITLERPGEFDKAWERDGVEEQPPQGTGKRTWWAGQILAGAELSVWIEHSGLDPSGVIDSIEDDDAGDALIALLKAVVLTRDAQWAGPIAKAVLARNPKQVFELTSLWPLLSPEDQASMAESIIQAPKPRLHDVLGALSTLPGPWPVELSTKVLMLLQKHAGPKKPDAWLLMGPIDTIVRQISPAAVDDMEKALTAMFSEESGNTIQKVIDKLRLRAEMHKEFKA